MNSDAVNGCLLGTAVGDALGLPYEGLRPDRARRLLGEPSRYRFFFKRGMVSDDTEHAVMVAQAMISSKRDPVLFASHLARHLRVWLLGVPAGVGLATLRSILKLWVGFPPSKSGVYSAGNGPAMRAPLLGVVTSGNGQMSELVKASTTITHSDPKAYWGSLAVAVASKLASSGDVVAPQAYLQELCECLPPESSEFLELVSSAVDSVSRGESTNDYALSLGHHRGVSGYVYHTVPVCIHAWLSYQDNFQEAVQAVIRCGGDADTTAAIVGGIVGSRVGPAGIPGSWVERLWEWPWNSLRLQRLGDTLTRSLTSEESGQPPKSFLLWRLPRNILFLVVVLLHGVRRLFPPY